MGSGVNNKQFILIMGTLFLIQGTVLGQTMSIFGLTIQLMSLFLIISVFFIKN